MALNEQQRLNISLHNSKENREILKVHINGTCYLANHELAFRGNDESVTSFKEELEQYFPEVVSYEYITNSFSVNPHDLAVGTGEQEELIDLQEDMRQR